MVRSVIMRNQVFFQASSSDQSEKGIANHIRCLDGSSTSSGSKVSKYW